MAAGPQAQSQRLFPSKPFWNEAGYKSINELTDIDRLSQTDQQVYAPPARPSPSPMDVGTPPLASFAPQAHFPQNPHHCHYVGVLVSQGGYN